MWATAEMVGRLLPAFEIWFDWVSCPGSSSRTMFATAFQGVAESSAVLAFESTFGYIWFVQVEEHVHHPAGRSGGWSLLHHLGPRRILQSPCQSVFDWSLALDTGQGPYLSSSPSGRCSWSSHAQLPSDRSALGQCHSLYYRGRLRKCPRRSNASPWFICIAPYPDLSCRLQSEALRACGGYLSSHPPYFQSLWVLDGRSSALRVPQFASVGMESAVEVWTPSFVLCFSFLIQALHIVALCRRGFSSIHPDLVLHLIGLIESPHLQTARALTRWAFGFCSIQQ